MTTIDTPAFQGSGVEPNALVRLLATPVKGGSGPAVVGKDTVTSEGDYEVVSAALRDGTYGFAVRLEDLAGNVSQPSPTLAVTIAKHALHLKGATKDVLVDIAEGRVSGYPGIRGGYVGILGIPLVDLDANRHGVAVRGGERDDHLSFTPTGVDSGRLTRTGSSQTLNFRSVKGDVAINTDAGDDEVTIVGTTRDDLIRGVVNTFTTLRWPGPGGHHRRQPGQRPAVRARRTANRRRQVQGRRADPAGRVAEGRAVREPVQEARHRLGPGFLPGDDAHQDHRRLHGHREADPEQRAPARQGGQSREGGRRQGHPRGRAQALGPGTRPGTKTGPGRTTHGKPPPPPPMGCRWSIRGSTSPRRALARRGKVLRGGWCGCGPCVCR
ncbi:Ig-like domain-containing protein [Streptomyces sp. NBC_01443]|uniref:Ig-like domain-containing protein n=1 Tax=Streptomyces sp. NBC_01443 TaxID=2903868 RepID=UPI00338E9549